ncbi:MAG: hypothetical protein K9K82_12130 [Desulfobacteraceae bacterium]|nr:hypothetical protein [Desulfobacteraceae bacterium]
MIGNGSYNSYVITDLDELREYARFYVGEILFALTASFPPSTDPVLINQTAYPPLQVRAINGSLTLQLNPSVLRGIPRISLKGWIEMEAAVFVISQSRYFKDFNFSTSILPLFPLSGSAVQFIRRIVSHLETVLKRVAATRMLMGLGRIEAQFYYHYYIVGPSATEADDYRCMLPHQWTRALFLANKCKQYSPAALLDASGLLPGIRSFWWDGHSFLNVEDRVTMEEMAEIATTDSAEQFSARVKDLFQILRTRLLM